MFRCRRTYEGPRYAVRQLDLSLSRYKKLRDLTFEGLLLGDYYIVWDNEKDEKVPYAGFRHIADARERARDLNTRPAPWNSTHAHMSVRVM